ncbi:MAG: transcription-repair coupling factor, partial [Desulfobulbaceae bacterium]|nr:transcription-repair coupling factor [Desulfobulbaceae bacterium]
RALMDYNELGGGFKLALSDLQIRGGGNILGESQSGTIAAVGYDLYLDLLQRTVEDLKRQGDFTDDGPSESSDIDPEINLKISAFIPETYIPDLDQRYIAYRRIASVTSDDEARDLQDEFTDRYGHLPPATLNLFGVVTLKLELKKLRICKLEEAPDALVFSFTNNTPASPERILLYVEHHKKKARLTPDSRLVIRIPTASSESIFETVRKILHSLG